MNLTHVLEPFAWPVVVYMTLAGISAGTVFLSALALLLGFQRWRRVARKGLLVGAAGIAIGSIFLVADLEAPGAVGLILTEFNPGSVISWGARVITLFGILSAYFGWIFGRQLEGSKSLSGGARVALITLAVLALAVALYPAWVLLQGSGRPLWQSPWIAPLFLVSALHTGLATLLLIRAFGRGAEGRRLAEEAPSLPGVRVEGVFVLTQLALLVLYFLTLSSGSGPAVSRMISGGLALWLWVGVVLVGWVLPLAETMAPGSDSRRIVLRALGILIGGLSLRALILFGGQGSVALFATLY